jgi:hypothetical protein
MRDDMPDISNILSAVESLGAARRQAIEKEADADGCEVRRL